MQHGLRTFKLALSLAVLSTGPLSSQTPADLATSNATATPVAYLYVPTPHGIYAYDVSSAGKPTVIKGSPFTQTKGLAIGSTGKYFITLGTYWLHSYAIEPNGAIGKQVSEVNTSEFAGGACETLPSENLVFGTDGAVLDRVGQNAYVFLSGTWDNGDGCAGYQTFNIAASGHLTFNTVDEWYTPANQQSTGGLIFAGNNTYGYAFIWNWGDEEAPYYWLTGFERGNHGALGGNFFYETDPEPQPGYQYNRACNCSSPVAGVAADSTDHLAAAITAYSGASDDFNPGATQLASYTVDSGGNISSTNTWENMPTISNPSLMVISPAGNLLAFAAGTGVQFYHFNGAKPITEFTGIIGTSGYISRMSWDKSNHLYAINGGTGNLHIYEVTTTSAHEVPGSPYVIPSGATNALVVSR